MAEFGLALPILLLVVYGVIETGRLVLIYASVVSAARNAVRYGSVAGDNGSGTPYYNDCPGIVAAADRLAFLEKFKNISISYDDGPGGNELSANCPVNVLGHPMNGDRIKVSVSADYSPIVPLVPFGPFTITSTGNRTLLIGVPIGVDVPPVILTPGATGAIAILKDTQDHKYTYDHVGQVITYTYALINNSSDPALGIIVHDNKAGGNNCGALSPLAPNDAGTAPT